MGEAVGHEKVDDVRRAKRRGERIGDARFELEWPSEAGTGRLKGKLKRVRRGPRDVDVDRQVVRAVEREMADQTDGRRGDVRGEGANVGAVDEKQELRVFHARPPIRWIDHDLDASQKSTDVTLS